MVQLIGLVFFIALMGVIFLGGSNHVSVNKISELSVKNDIMTSYQVLQQGEMIYREHNDKKLAVTDWKINFEKYAFLPNDVIDLTWQYNKNGVGYYFCLTGIVTDENIYKAIINTGDKMSQNSYFVNETCGSTSNFSLTPDLSTSPIVSATFFIK